jgi:hypothetical protein
MAKTATKLSEKEVSKAFAKLEKAAGKFTQAISEFQAKYDPDTVGLDEWRESVDEVLGDISVDIDSTFADE